MSTAPKMSEKQLLLRLSDRLEDGVDDATSFLSESVAQGTCPSPDALSAEIRRLYEQDGEDGMFRINMAHVAEIANNYLADSAPEGRDDTPEATGEQLASIQEKLSEKFSSTIHDMIVQTVYEVL